jgi:transcriptional regulator with XRE-family HTH domain
MAAPVENLLGDTIRKARERLKLTGEDIRREAGIHPTSLSFVERGQQALSGEQMERLAPVLRIRAERLAVLQLKSRIVSRRASKAARQPTKNV